MASAVFVVAAAHAADAEVEALLSKMRNVYKQTKTATFTTETKLGDNVIVSNFSFSGPAKIHVEFTIPTPQGAKASVVEITDGKTIYLKLPTQTEFQQKPFTANDLDSDLAVNLESICFYDWEKQLSTEKGKNMEHSTFKILPGQEWDGKKWTVLEETSSTDKVLCSYYIDPKTSLIWRTTVKALAGGDKSAEMDCKITKMNLGVKLDDSIFTIEHV